MAADSSIDGQFDWIFHYFYIPIRFLAAHALPASMAAYVYAMELWANCIYQFNRSLIALIDSFHKEVIYFYEDGTQYYPVPTVLREKPAFLTGNSTWTYDVKEKQFIQSPQVDARKYRIPYLGASLTYTVYEPDAITSTVGDLSEWIADQTILSSTNELPLQVLVAAWAYCNRVPLFVGFKGYTLTVMNEEGDEISYSLTHDTTDTESEAAPTSSSMSIASHENGSIQIIGERILPQSLYDLLLPSAPTNTPLPASPETVSSEDDEPKKDK
jgi:hypothetical protein